MHKAYAFIIFISFALPPLNKIAANWKFHFKNSKPQWRSTS